LQKQLILFAAIALIVIAGAAPLVAMLANSVIVDGTFSTSAYTKVFGTSARYVGPLARTLLLAGIVSLISGCLGTLLGLLLGKTDLPARRLWIALLAVPLCVPPYVLAVGWSSLLASVASPAFTAWFQGLPGCVWTMTSALTPLVMIVTIVALRGIDPRVEEAGRVSAPWLHVLRHITLPLAWPVLAFVGLIVFLLVAGEVGVPLLLHYSVYPAVTLTQFAAFYDFAAASASAVPLLAVALLFVIVEQRVLAGRAPRLSAVTPGQAQLRIHLHDWGIPLAFIAGSVVVLLGVPPVLALLQSSFSPFGYARAWTAVGNSLLRSLMYAAAGATALAAVGFACGYVIERRAAPWWRAADMLTLALFTVPGTVIGIGLIAMWNHAVTAFLYASGLTVVIAYIAQYNALTTRVAAGALAQVPTSREDAARMVGAPWLHRIRYIVIPAMWPALAVAWLIAFIFCLRDLGASQLVYPPGAEPFTVRIFTLMANGSPSVIAAACVMLIGINMAMLAALAVAIHRLSR
jgi:iron(III) transport system permease protein